MTLLARTALLGVEKAVFRVVDHCIPWNVDPGFHLDVVNNHILQPSDN